MKQEMKYIDEMVADPGVQLTAADVEQFRASGIPIKKLFCYGKCVASALADLAKDKPAHEVALALLDCIKSC